jgi:hypothetical protein
VKHVQKRGVPLCFSLPFNGSWCNRSVRQHVILFIDTNTNFFFRADHEQLRYKDCVLAQGALIQVQQGLGKHKATKLLELGTDVTELLVET